MSKAECSCSVLVSRNAEAIIGLRGTSENELILSTFRIGVPGSLYSSASNYAIKRLGVRVLISNPTLVCCCTSYSTGVCGCLGILEDRFPPSRFRTYNPQLVALIFIRIIQRLCFQPCLPKQYKTVDGFLLLSRQSRSFRQ